MNTGKKEREAGATGGGRAELSSLPQEVILTGLLPWLDEFSLCRVSQTSKGLQANVTSFLLSRPALNMTRVSRRIERTGELATSTRRKQAAFRFLTVNHSVARLRWLEMDDHPAMPAATLSTVKKLIRQNKRLETLLLVNMKLPPATLQLISGLASLQQLTLSPDICQDKEDRFSDIMEQLESRGCSIKFHYDYF